MILLSNIIKSFAYVALDDKKVIESTMPIHMNPDSVDEEDAYHSLSPEQQQELQEANSMKDQILQDAESYANEQIQLAMQECAAMREQVQVEIDDWWQDRRTQDEEIINSAQSAGFEEGYQQGTSQAEAALRQEYDEMLSEARSILEQSYHLKQQIIQESEPFLIELSTMISEKIIRRQLTVSPDWVIDLIQKVLSRRKEKGTITLCVAPHQFAYIQDAREELLTSIDSQAELEIIPDSTVADHGCVVRSNFGSIDARIDTQLKEIKSALQEIAVRSDGDES
ncbi:flagellar assembly protein H [compost metagenome]